MEELSYVLTKNLLLQCNTQASFSATLSTSLEDQKKLFTCSEHFWTVIESVSTKKEIQWLEHSN